jgi:hypothetical protein
MHTDGCGDTSGQKSRTKGNRKEKKYMSFCIEIQQMWNMKCITGATGRVKKVSSKFWKPC